MKASQLTVLDTVHEFSCEIDQNKQWFTLNLPMGAPRILLSDVRDLGRRFAVNERNNKKVVVADEVRCHFLFMGLTCKSAFGFNSTEQGQVLTQEGQFARTFRALLCALDAQFPLLLFAENLVGLSVHSQDSYALECIKQKGYVGKLLQDV